MAIAPVNSVSFRKNYNQVNFEGKKKEKSSGMHVPMAVKAIPLATMLAMSPLNEINAENVIEAGKTEVTDAPITNAPKNKTFTYYTDYAVKRAWPETVTVEFDSYDGDRKPESVTLHYRHNRTGGTMINGVRTPLIIKDLKRLDVFEVKVVNVKRECFDGTIVDDKKEYYAVGLLAYHRKKYNEDGSTLIEDQGVEMKSNHEEEITPSFYKKLVDTMGDKLKQTSVDEIKKSSGDSYLDMINYF